MAYPTKTGVIIVDLLERKNIRALNFMNVHDIKYHINQNNFKEYLMLVIYNGIKLLDINNNYNIINIEGEKWNKFSRYTMFFPENTNNEYLIATEFDWYYGETYYSNTVTTKLFSLNEKKDKVIFCNYYYIHDDYGQKGENINTIVYLLVWHNERNNNYYIIQFAQKIIITNIFTSELYCEFLSDAENGCIYNKEINNTKNAYLCIARNYNIVIYDLYKKEEDKIIRPFHHLINIFKWNEKYIIVIDGYLDKEEQKKTNVSLKVIDLENKKVISKFEGKHANKISYIKKINHPIYGESLLSGGVDDAIKLWVV